MIELLLGWKKLNHYPKKKCVIVFSHTSYWDLLIWFLYFRNTSFVLVNPNYYNWATKWIYNALNLIPSTRIEDKGLGLVGYLSKRFKEGDCSLILSPKGTVKKKEWKTGYYHIARGLGVKIYPFILDFEKREGYFGPPCDPNTNTEPWCKDFLITQFKKGVEFNLENVEYARDYDIITQNPYERIFPFDFCLVSLLVFIPHILILLKHNYYGLGGLGSIALASSFIYHYRQEGENKPVKYIRWVELGSVYSTFIMILLRAYPYYRTLSYSCYLTFLLGYIFLRCGYHRELQKKRGRYTLYHSVYHILVALGMIQLTESFVYS